MPISTNLSEDRMKIVRYLLIPDHPERLVMLKDLDLLGVWGNNSLNHEGLIQRYVTENNRNFCQAGIDRFLEEFSEYKPKTKTGRIQVLLEVDLDNVPENFGSNPSSDCNIANLIREAVKESLDRRIRERGLSAITKNVILNYAAKKT